MVKESKKKTVILIISLSALLLAALIYVAVDIYSDYRDSRDLKFYQQGASYGYEAAVYSLVQQAVKCEQVPVTISENQTINMIAVECLQPAQ